METKQYWIGFDLGGTKMLATLFDDSLNKVFQIKRKTRTDAGLFGVERLVDTIQKLLTEWGGSPPLVKGIGIGAPGALNPETGVVVSAPNLGWKNVRLCQELESAFSLPATVVNDVDAGTYGEYIAGAGKDARCVLGVFPGTGIGGGCIYEGKILRATTASITEIGHLRVCEDGLLCGCGNRGCLETVASRLAIAGQAAIAAYRGQAPSLFTAAGCDITKIKSGVIAASITAGDTAIENIVRYAACTLGKGIATVVNILAPDVIVLGGGLVEKMPLLYHEEVTTGMGQALFPPYRNTGRLVIAQLGDDAVSLGAAAVARSVTKQTL